jgi:hypothetical protein
VAQTLLSASGETHLGARRACGHVSGGRNPTTSAGVPTLQAGVPAPRPSPEASRTYREVSGKSRPGSLRGCATSGRPRHRFLEASASPKNRLPKPGDTSSVSRRPAKRRVSFAPRWRASAQCHLVFPRAHTCIIGGADPLVRCRPPGSPKRECRPFDFGMHLILRRKSGTRASRADQGSAPPLTPSPSFAKTK